MKEEKHIEIAKNENLLMQGDNSCNQQINTPTQAFNKKSQLSQVILYF